MTDIAAPASSAWYRTVDRSQRRLLNREINAVLADPRIKARIADLGETVLATTPGEFRKLIAGDTDRWAKGAKFSGTRTE